MIASVSNRRMSLVAWTGLSMGDRINAERALVPDPNAIEVRHQRFYDPDYISMSGEAFAPVLMVEE